MNRNQKIAPENPTTLETLFQSHGFADFRWLAPENIVVAQWVRMICLFGCPEYGRNASCPPYAPAVPECERFFREYHRAVVFHIPHHCSIQAYDEWARKINRDLIKLERSVFLAGYQKAFMLLIDACNLCSKCSGDKVKCNNPKSSRPTVEALAVDVYATVRNVDYPIQVLASEQETMNRYALLMVE